MLSNHFASNDTSNMDMSLICNKCFTPTYRGKRPFNITQCGHVFCLSCIQQVEEQHCFQCKCNNPAYLPLEEPLIPKRISLFTPFSEILEILLNMETVRNNQMKITMQRFRILDSKYEMLKKHYLIGRRNVKILLEKYTILKGEKEKLNDLQKQLLQMQNNTPQSAMMSSGPISTHSLNSRYSAESLRHLKFSNLNLSNNKIDKPIRFVNQKEQRKVDDSGSSKLIKFLFTPSINSNYNFMK